MPVKHRLCFLKTQSLCREHNKDNDTIVLTCYQEKYPISIALDKDILFLAISLFKQVM